MAVPNEANILEWHYVIEGNTDTPYKGGYYHGKLIFPKEYPLKPPSVIMLTPSGRFKPNRRLCLSMSDFHPESWNPMWSVSTILTGLYSFMIETKPTLGSIETSEAMKRKLASQSLGYNVRDATFCKLFPDLVDLYKQQQRERQFVTGESATTISGSDGKITLRVGEDGDEMRGVAAVAAGVVALLSLLFALRFF